MWDFMFPRICLFCLQMHTSSRRLCDACYAHLPIIGPHCQQCAQALCSPAFNCGQCLQHPPPMARTLARFPYEPPIVQAIIRLKFNQQLIYADLFAELLLDHIRHHWYREQSLPDIILPVPLHVTRLRERGFNQAVEIARPIARALNIPLDLHHTLRSKATRAQSGLSATARGANLKQAFSTEHTYQGVKIAVIDDVVTTGHTVRALCQLLRLQGAGPIDVWCCARRMHNIQAALYCPHSEETLN